MKTGIEKLVGLNLEGYMHLFALENLLRVRLNQVLSERFGPFFFVKGRYVLKKKNKECDLYEEAISTLKKEQAEKLPGSGTTPLMYYLNFWHLGFIIEQDWARGKLSELFPGNWSMKKIRETLASLDLIRNRIAHNRPIREIELQEIRVAYDYFLRHLRGASIEEVHSMLESSPNGGVTPETVLEEILQKIQKGQQLPDDWERNLKRLLNKVTSPGVNLWDLAEILKKYDKIPNVTGARSKRLKLATEIRLLEKLKAILNMINNK